jgi:hypothetical protein
MKKLPCTEADLRMMLDSYYVDPSGPVDYVMEYMKDNDLTPELCQSLHNFQANLHEYGSAASMQSVRQRLHTLLFMDEWEPLNPEKCWSESIRRDFRAMESDRKAKWRRLLKHIRGNAPKRMPRSWAQEASRRFAVVGIDDFNQQLALWFAPFRSGEPLPLSIAGSHVLKGLVWYVAVSGDETAKQTALWLLDVKWKQKRNMEKAMTALEVLGISEQELLKRNLIAKPLPRTPDPLAKLLDVVNLGRTFSEALKNPTGDLAQKLIEKMQSGESSEPILKKVSQAMKPWLSTEIQVDHDEGLMVVQGQQHFYRLFLATGRIERVTDNAELELDWERIPNSLRQMVRSEPDLPRQCNLLAQFLRFDSQYAGYFRVKENS